MLIISSKAIENNGAAKSESILLKHIKREKANPGTSRRNMRKSEEMKKAAHIELTNLGSGTLLKCTGIKNEIQA